MPTSLALFRQTHNVKFFLRHFLQAIPLVLKLHVGVFLVEEFPVDIHLLLLDNLVIIRFAGLRGMAAAFGLIADAQGTNAHQVFLDSHVTEQLPSLLRVEHLTLPVNPAGAESYLMGCQHHGLKDDAAVIDHRNRDRQWFPSPRRSSSSDVR